MPEPLLRSAPLVPGRAGGRARLARARPVLVPARPRRRAASCRRTTGRPSSAARPGPGRPSPDGTPGEWYLHLFAPEQPDFNWANPEVRDEFEDILRFWFDRGADGIRIDSAALLTKDPPAARTGRARATRHPYTDRDDVHDIYRAWRAVADNYPGRVLIGEVWLADSARFASYLRPDELHTVFNFPYLCCPWDAARLRAVIDSTLEFHAARGRAGHLGAVQPRRRPARVPLRPRRHLLRPATGATTASRSTWPSAPAGPAPRRCSPWRCPARSTSTRARNSACGRSRTSRTSGARTRSGTAPAAPTRDATAAGCRCPGPATSRRSASRRRTPPRSPGCRSRRTGAT